MSELLLKKELAELLEVSPGSITFKFPKGHPALVKGKIDTDHPEVQEYIQMRETKLKNLKTKPNTAEPVKTSNFVAPAVPENAPKPKLPEELANLTLQEIVDLYGHLPSFKSYVSSLTALETLKQKNTRMRQDRGMLIDKKREGRALFEILEMLFKRLVDEIPKTGIRRIISVVKRADGDSELDATKIYQEMNGRALKTCKNDILSRLEMTEEELTGADNVA
ncbi:MAG: hypothetical protein GY847_03380 [Proteobacteria bacterium]|nr:hypothetical protein [Pseudomonadota bacterium]